MRLYKKKIAAQQNAERLNFTLKTRKGLGMFIYLTCVHSESYDMTCTGITYVHQALHMYIRHTGRQTMIIVIY